MSEHGDIITTSLTGLTIYTSSQFTVYSLSRLSTKPLYLEVNLKVSAPEMSKLWIKFKVPGLGQW